MLRPTFLSFETAKRALSTSQRGLDTVGHNISNVNTAGYTRQRVDQVSISSSGYKTKFQTYGSQFSGQGSMTTGITQIRDPFLDNRYRTEATNAGELTSKGNALADINAIFDEIKVDGSHAKLEQFLNALDKLTGEAFSKENATILRTAADEIAKLLNRNMSDLQTVKTQQQEELGFAVKDVNTMLEQIAFLNSKIEEDNFYGNPANELNDQRNLLIDQLSEMMDIKVNRTPFTLANGITIEKLSIEIKGSGTNGSKPVMLVDSGNYNKLAVATEKDGSVSSPAQITLVDSSSGYPIYNPPSDKTSDNITGKLLAGGLKGIVDVLNGVGPATGAMDANTFRGIPYYESMLNDYATTLAETLNGANSIKVIVNTSPVEYKTVDRPLFQFDPNSPASTLAISDEWILNPMYVTEVQQNNALYANPSTGFLQVKDGNGDWVDTDLHYNDLAGVKLDKDGNLMKADGTLLAFDHDGDPGTADITLNMDNLRKCYTVSKDGDEIGDPLRDNYVPSGDAANDGLHDLKLALTNKKTNWQNGFTGNFQEYLTSMQSTMGQDAKLNESLLDASVKVLTGLADSRDSVSAVSIDEEGINMMTYQNYYNAAARYMTVLDEALGTIIQNMGTVGR